MTSRSPRPPHRLDRARPRRAATRGRGACAIALALTVGAAVGSGCSSSSNTAAPDTKPAFSITIPPNATGGGTLPDAGSVPSAGGAGLDVGPSTSVAPGNEDFCTLMEHAGKDFTGPSEGSQSDDQVLASIKQTFQQLADTAPTGIKPEVTGMNNTIQAMSSPDDIQKMDDPTFTDEQAAVAKWVQDNCGIELGG